MLLVAVGELKLERHAARSFVGIRRVGAATAEREARHNRNGGAGEELGARIGRGLGHAHEAAGGAGALGVVLAQAWMRAVDGDKRIDQDVPADVRAAITEAVGAKLLEVVDLS